MGWASAAVAVDVADVAGGDAWRDLGTFDGAAVAVRRARVRAIRSLPISCNTVIATLEDVPTFSSWITLAAWEVVSDDRTTGGKLRMHGLHTMPFPFAARDYVVEYTVERADPAFTLKCKSVNAGPPKKAGVVRLDVVSTWIAAPDGAGCRVVYEYNGDLGGSFPGFLLEGVWKAEGPNLLAGLLKAAQQRSKP